MLVPVSPRFPIVHNSTVNRFGVVSPAFDIKYVASWGFDQSCLLATWEKPCDIHFASYFSSQRLAQADTASIPSLQAHLDVYQLYWTPAG